MVKLLAVSVAGLGGLLFAVRTGRFGSTTETMPSNTDQYEYTAHMRSNPFWDSIDFLKIDVKKEAKLVKKYGDNMAPLTTVHLDGWTRWSLRPMQLKNAQQSAYGNYWFPSDTNEQNLSGFQKSAN